MPGGLTDWQATWQTEVMTSQSILSARPSDLSYHRVTGEITIGYKSLGFVQEGETRAAAGRRALAAAQAEHRAWLAESNRQHAQALRERRALYGY